MVIVIVLLGVFWWIVVANRLWEDVFSNIGDRETDDIEECV